MSGHDPISALLSIFPDVTEAAEKYKITEPDRESRGLARGIANEKIQFHETAQRLNFLSIKAGSSGNCNWVQRAEERFGSEKAGQILHDLQSLTSQLLTLETDLINAGRKKEILDKIQGRAFGPVKGRDRNSRTQLQRTLDGVSNTNRLLASRLSSAPTLLTRAFQTSDTRGPLLFRREFGSSKTAACKSPSSTMWSIPSQEPVLAKLGICLIELAFGKPLSELRREDSGRDSLKDHDELDADSLDLITAKKLFMSQRIRYEFGEPFEDAVRACVHQQFRAEKSDNIVKLDREHPSFLQNAVTSIISPLQLQMKKYLRAGQRNSVSNKETNSKAFNESQNELGKRASRQHSEDKQWFAIFAIIFPGDPLPSSAYIDPSLLDNANAYQDFVTTEGSGILYQFLQSRNALNLNVPRGLEHDLETFQRQMLAEGLVAISEEWSRRGAGAALSSESESAEVVNADSASLGADVESMSSLQPTSITSSIGHPGYAISDSEPPWSYQNPQQGFVPSIPPFEMTQMTMIIDGSTADESLDWAGTHDHDFTDYM
ncbi:hypothetical protein CGCF413_v012404 [Colletotrichum fructicola]|nr:hypothetical protein CGCF413_v012404 [Colletotrichum fructicola]